MFSKLVIVLLLAVTIGLYLKIVMVEGQHRSNEPMPQASVQVVEDAVPSTATTAEVPKAPPEDQMTMIKQVFAPELLKD